MRPSHSCSREVWQPWDSCTSFAGTRKGPDSPLQAAIALCIEQGFVYFRAVVSAFHGANLVRLGKPKKASR